MVFSKISGLFELIKPPLPTFMIFGDPVEAIMMSDKFPFPNSCFSSPIPAEASSIVVIPLLPKAVIF